MLQHTFYGTADTHRFNRYFAVLHVKKQKKILCHLLCFTFLIIFACRLGEVAKYFFSVSHLIFFSKLKVGPRTESFPFQFCRTFRKHPVYRRDPRVKQEQRPKMNPIVVKHLTNKVG